MNTITDDGGLRPLDVVYRCYECRADYVLLGDSMDAFHPIVVDLPGGKREFSQLCPECAVKSKELHQ